MSTYFVQILLLCSSWRDYRHISDPFKSLLRPGYMCNFFFLPATQWIKFYGVVGASNVATRTTILPLKTEDIYFGSNFKLSTVCTIAWTQPVLRDSVNSIFHICPALRIKTQLYVRNRMKCACKTPNWPNFSEFHWLNKNSLCVSCSNNAWVIWYFRQSLPKLNDFNFQQRLSNLLGYTCFATQGMRQLQFYHSRQQRNEIWSIPVLAREKLWTRVLIGYDKQTNKSRSTERSNPCARQATL